MLKLFRNNQIYTAISVLIYSLPFFMSHFWENNPKTIATEDYPFLLSWLPNLCSWGHNFTGILFFVLLLVLAFWLNLVININRLGKRATYYTAISFILCAFAFPASDVISPALFSNFCIIAAIVQLYKAYEKKTSVLEVFNAALLGSTAALLYAPAVWYILFVALAWFILRTFNSKEFIILLIGFFVPYYLLGTYMYLNNRFLDWWQRDIAGSFGRLNFEMDITISFWISLGIWVFLLLFAVINLRGLKYKTTIREQKFIDVLLWLLIISCFTWIGQKHFGQEDLITIALPLSIFLSLNLQSFQNEKLSGYLHFLLFIAAIFAQYEAHIL